MKTLQVAIIAFDNIDIPIICNPYLKEVGGSKLPENHFRGIVNLLNDKNLQNYSLFDKIDLSLITPEWSNSYEANNAPRKVTYLSDKLLRVPVKPQILKRNVPFHMGSARYSTLQEWFGSERKNVALNDNGLGSYTKKLRLDKLE